MTIEADLYAKWKIKDFEFWTLYLYNKNQYYLGRSSAWLKRAGEMQNIGSTTINEWIELRTVSIVYAGAIERLWGITFTNDSLLGNEFHQHRGHLHMHMIPRFSEPVLFAGHEFRDEQWGKDYKPCPDFVLPEDMLILIRDALRDEIR